MKKKNLKRVSLELGRFEKVLSEKSVLRLAVKVFDSDEVIDLRVWGIDPKSGQLYPRRNGICMKLASWHEALKLFSDNKLPASSNANGESRSIDSDTITNDSSAA